MSLRQTTCMESIEYFDQSILLVREYRYIPEAYGLQGSTEASVTKHLSRKKLNQEQVAIVIWEQLNFKISTKPSN